MTDIVITSNTSNPCSGNCYSQGYRYIYIVNTGDVMSGSYQSCVRLSFQYNNNYWGQNVGSFSNYIVAELPSSNYNLTQVTISSSTCSVTISDSLPSEWLPSAPSGTLSITENGTYNVSSYASAEVDVPPIYGDYHDDLVNINHSIIIASAVILVIYFFWCIYRMIIKPLRS